MLHSQRVIHTINSVKNTFMACERCMRATVVTIFCSLVTLLSVEAQEVAFEPVKLPTRPGETVGSVSLPSSLSAVDRRVLQVEYRKADLSFSRYAFVGIQGTEAQELLDPYRDNQAPYFTDIKPLAYKDKVVISIQNVGPGGVDSIWVTDGTTAGTREIANVDPGPYPFIINDTLVLITQDTAVTFVDLKTGAVTRIAEATPLATGYGYLGEFADGRGLFHAAGSVYVSDGTVAGTQVIKNLPSPHFYGFSKIIFEKTNSSALRAFTLQLGESDNYFSVVTDGTVAGTRDIPEANFQHSENKYRSGYQLGNKILYGNSTQGEGQELWSLDLVSLQASILKDVNPGAASGYNGTGKIRSVNKKVFFIANDGTHGDEVWVTDGTSAGTVLTKDIAPGAGYGVSYSDYNYPSHSSVGQYLIFGAQPSAIGGYKQPGYPQELWASDGTSDGTFKLASSIPSDSYGSSVINDNGVLAFPSFEEFGLKLPGEQTKWNYGAFLRFFDPTLGPPPSAFLVTRADTGQPIRNVAQLSKVGEYYYIDVPTYNSNSVVWEVFVAPRQLCAGSDFKVIPGQCGCGVEELPADSSGGIVQSNADSDGSAVCMTPIGPIFVPATLSGAIAGQLSQKAGQADSVQLTIPASLQNALQVVTTAPNLDISSKAVGGEVLSTKASSKFKVQHTVSLVVFDKRKKSVKKLSLRRTAKGTLKIKLGRRLTPGQVLTFQYAVGADRGGQQLVQTPYKKSGAIKLVKRKG